MAAEPYCAELKLSRVADGPQERWALDLELVDAERVDVGAFGRAFLDLDANLAQDGSSASSVLETFLRGERGLPEDGRRLGVYLLDRLLGDKEVERLWTEIQKLRGKHPLRLELSLPERDAPKLAEVPFELLADREGFLFTRPGWVLVRALQKTDRKSFHLREGHRLQVAWANPTGESELPQKVFDQHETVACAEAGALGLSVNTPCRHATRTSLSESLRLHDSTEVVSLIAHGSPEGGQVHLHVPDHPEYPKDPGEPVHGSTLAGIFRQAGVEVAFLWSCHGARRSSSFGALATSLLNPNDGDLTAVVASHAALRAQETPTVMAAILHAWRTTAGGDLERAVGEGRQALLDSDLQWAAPAYYARPRGGQSVTFESAAAQLEAVARARAARTGGRPVLENAPPPWSHFRGRERQLDRGAELLRVGRLLSVTGLPGMGKTEVALELARKAVEDPSLAIERAIWRSVDGVTRTPMWLASLGADFGVPPERTLDPDAVARAIGARHVLLVLDNAEDLIREDRPEFLATVERILGMCPNLKLILSTRRKLGSPRSAEEMELPVHALAPSAARDAFRSAAGNRLKAGEETSTELARILEWLDGHPLSLMLVARQVGTTSLKDLLERLETSEVDAVRAEESLEDGEGAAADARLRNQRLVSSLNLSYDPLVDRYPAAAEMFSWLGLFPSGVPGVLLPLVFGKEADDLRATLCRWYLAEEEGPLRRLRLPAPVRAYARQQWNRIEEARRTGVLRAAMRAMGDWMSSLYGRIGKVGSREVVATVAEDWVNLQSLLAVLEGLSGVFRGEEDGAVAEYLARAMWAGSRALTYGGRQAGLAVDLVKAAKLAAGFPSAEARIMESLGDLFVRTDRLADALDSYNQALPLFRQIDDKLGEANTLAGLACLFMASADYDGAIDRSLAALALHRSIHNDLGEAAATGYLARAVLAAGQPVRAVVLAHLAFRTLVRIQNCFGQTLALRDLAKGLAALDRNEEASAAMLLAWHIADTIGDPLSTRLRSDTGLEPPDSATVEQMRTVLDGAVARCTKELAYAGVDPFSPLNTP